MKQSLILLSLLFALLACTRHSTTDLANIQCYNDFKNLKQQLDSAQLLKANNLNGKTYQGDHLVFFSCKVEYINFTSDGFELYLDSTKINDDKLLSKISKKYGAPKILKQSSAPAEEWDNDFLNITWHKHLFTFESINVTYKPSYSYEFPNLFKLISVPQLPYLYTIKEGKEDYTLQVQINGIPIPAHQDENFRPEYLLNPWLTNGTNTISTIINGQVSDNYTLVRSIAGVDSSEVIIHPDQITLPFVVAAWTQGSDLRNDPNLKEKIIASYEKLAKAFINNDLKTISSMLLLKQKEWMICNYQSKYEDSTKPWTDLEYDAQNLFKYKISNDFKLEFYDGGKLVKAIPSNHSSMLHLIGKRMVRDYDFYFFQELGSNELQIIR